MVMTTSSAYAEVIDGLCYDLNYDTKTATLIPRIDNEKYYGDIIIPEKVKGNDGEEYVVTEFGPNCFEDCSSLTSISIPSSVTLLGEGCFWDCSGMTSITIPSSVTYMGNECFSGCQALKTVYFEGKVPRIDSSGTGISYTSNIKVPAEYFQDYKKALGSDYLYISAWNPNELDDNDKSVAPCATPTISYESGELKFACETAGAKYHYTISSRDMITNAISDDGNVSLSATYHISVYATADNHTASPKAEASSMRLMANFWVHILPLEVLHHAPYQKRRLLQKSAWIPSKY